jgi:hypothetical protein
MDRHEVHIGNKTFGLTAENFQRIEHTIYPGTKHVRPLIDRDGNIFEQYIWPYLVGYKLYLKETKKETLWRIYSDAEFYKLPELRQQVGELLGNATLNPAEFEAKVKDEMEKVKSLFSTLVKLISTWLGPRLGDDTFLQTIIDETSDQIEEYARQTVENGDSFLNLNPQSKLFMAVFIKIYLNVLSKLRQHNDPPPEENRRYNFPGAPAPVIRPVPLNFRQYQFVPNPAFAPVDVPMFPLNEADDDSFDD